MPVLQKDAERVRLLLASAKRILCICHRNPDGDAVGALLGAGLLLERAFPDTPVSLHCADSVPDTFSFLPAVARVQGPPVLQEGDSAVMVDSAEPKLTEMHETHPQLFDGTVPCVNIDHHPANPRFGTVNVIDPKAASSCEIVAEIARHLQWELTGDIATCLLTGVYTDTGGLLHSNTTAEVYRTVAQLLRAGARRQEIVRAVFRTAKLSTLRLWGRVLENISITEEGAAITAVRESDFRATGADYSELTGAIDYVNAVPGMRFSMVLSERGGAVKGSLRTLRDDVDVSAMAGVFSGGGHRRAAGFSVDGRLKPEIRWTVVPPESSRPEEQEA
ncbi:MAG: DHH family phosphoesterase [Candidatus Peribacteraceae bacterium]|nr:DHH family phosphoesterase [Candidatus Peribacteraceae bacterium]